MISDAGAYGGVVALCLFVVAPITLLVYAVGRSFFFSFLGVTAGWIVLGMTLWVVGFDSRRFWKDFWFFLFYFSAGLMTSFVTGLAAASGRHVYRRWCVPQRR
jgi:hypothetical protein